MTIGALVSALMGIGFLVGAGVEHPCPDVADGAVEAHAATNPAIRCNSCSAFLRAL
jgi:hypothetical protein